MIKKPHPAESTRKLVGATAGLALVGMVTGFQVSAQAQTQNSLESLDSQTVQQPVPGSPVSSTPDALVENPSVPVTLEQLPTVVSNAEQVLPPQPSANLPEPALVAPVPEITNSYAPVNGTTSGSGG